MIQRDDLPDTPDWDISRVLTPSTSEAIRLPLRFEGDDG
jgi:hypothetical protein